jgi:non-ribosomal peptide synthase protein (TIGR01720 family)
VCADLTAAETETLLREVPKLFRAGAGDALLTAILLAVTDWSGAKDLLIELEDDGRRALAYEADFSRTVGCFDTAYPVLLERGESGAPADLLKTVKEQLRRVPGHGLGYGLLRYSRGDERLAGELRALPGAEVKFTRLLENPVSAVQHDALFGPMKLPARVSRDGRAIRQHLFEVAAAVEEGRLRMIWTYSENMHSAETAHKLAKTAIASLRSIIRACGEGHAAGYTPSDFPLLKLDQRQLDKLLSDIGGASGRTPQGRS